MSTAISTMDDEEATQGIGSSLMAMGPTSTIAVQMAGAMVDKQISTAKAYPRSVALFKKAAAALLSEDLETAKSAEYAKPQGGGVVKGASIRLAELAASCWGNLKLELGSVDVTDRSVTVSVNAWDMEKNYTAFGISSTSILKKDGTRMPAHVVENLTMATASKARRNAILSVIPKAYVTDLLEVARKVAAGKKPPLEVSRQKSIEYFQRQYSIKPDQITAYLQVAGTDDISEDHLDLLRAIDTGIKEGTAKLEEFFTTPAAENSNLTKARDAAAKLVADKAKDAAAKPPVESKQAEAAATVPPPPTVPPVVADAKVIDDKTIFLDLCAKLSERGETEEELTGGMFPTIAEMANRASKATLQKSIRRLTERLETLKASAKE